MLKCIRVCDKKEKQTKKGLKLEMCKKLRQNVKWENTS